MDCDGINISSQINDMIVDMRADGCFSSGNLQLPNIF